MRKPRYSLNTSTSGVGRTYPQHQEMLGPYDYDAPDSIKHLRDCNFDFADFEPNFRTVVLDKRAKATDLISSVPIPKVGHIVSTRFLDLLREFKLPPHRLYPVPMIHKGEPVDGYWFVHLPHPQSLLAATSFRDVEERCSTVPELEDVSLLKLYQPFTLAYTWIDARLKAAIESAGITGVTIGG